MFAITPTVILVMWLFIIEEITTMFSSVLRRLRDNLLSPKDQYVDDDEEDDVNDGSDDPWSDDKVYQWMRD